MTKLPKNEVPPENNGKQSETLVHFHNALKPDVAVETLHLTPDEVTMYGILTKELNDKKIKAPTSFQYLSLIAEKLGGMHDDNDNKIILEFIAKKLQEFNRKMKLAA